jgi:predicted nucleotide-binding protein
MSLPIRTTLTDITALCGYLFTKPMGATVAEAKAVLDSTVLDGRKMNAMEFWGLIEENQDTGRLKLTELGRVLAKNKFAQIAEQMRKVIKRVPAYMAIIERAFHNAEYTITTNEVAAHWHTHFSREASESEKVLNDQTVCFFHVAEAADLGEITIGRGGHPTRFSFAAGNLEAMLDNVAHIDVNALAMPGSVSDLCTLGDETVAAMQKCEPTTVAPRDKGRVFITHGKNSKILGQVKEIVTYGGFEPVVTMERETAAKPVPEKVLNDMRNCEAAVIHVAVDGIIVDQDGKEHPQINGNVLIEIGAAMGLYRGYKFILLVEEGLMLPSNLQGLYECRYSGDELSASATMKLLRAFNEFKLAAL